MARDQATAASDVDLLVEFDRPVGYFGLLALQDHLESLFGCKVDLGTPGSLKPRIRPRSSLIITGLERTARQGLSSLDAGVASFIGLASVGIGLERRELEHAKTLPRNSDQVIIGQHAGPRLVGLAV